MGTQHDIPSTKGCNGCHTAIKDNALGFSALQLSHNIAGSFNLAQAIQLGWFNVNPPAEGYALPGTDAEKNALGYLHANCGHCHNRNGTAWPDTQMVMRLQTDEADLTSSAVYRSLVGQRLQYWRGGVITERVAAGDPDASAVVARMSTRGNDDQMPPLATEFVDPDGVAAVRAWIASLAPAAP